MVATLQKAKVSNNILNLWHLSYRDHSITEYEEGIENQLAALSRNISLA